MAARRTVISPFVVNARRTLSALVERDASGIAKIPRLMCDSALRNTGHRLGSNPARDPGLPGWRGEKLLPGECTSTQ